MLFQFDNLKLRSSLGPLPVKPVSGTVDHGEILAVRGPSGAGKSTLFRTLARLQQYGGGEAYLKGDSWRNIPGTIWRSSIHYLPQKPVLFNGSVSENLFKPFETRINSHKRLNPELAKALLKDLLLPDHLWEQDARTLSGGEAARVAFTRAVLLDPAVLLLDEPTAALDEKARKSFYQMLQKWLKRPGRAAMLVSHNNDYAEFPGVSILEIIPVKEGE